MWILKIYLDSNCPIRFLGSFNFIQKCKKEYKNIPHTYSLLKERN